MLKVALSAIILVNALKEVGIKVGPLLKGIFLSEHTGCYALGNQGCFDGKGTTTAHGVDKVALASPSCLKNDSGRQYLIQGSFHCFLTVATTVQTLTCTIQCQGAIVLCHVDVQLDVGVDNTDVGTVTGLLSELVNDSILHLIGDKLGVLEFVAEYHAIHGKCSVVRQVLCPINLLHGIVYLVCGLCLEVADGLENAYSRAQLEVGSIHHLLITSKRHHAASYLDVIGTKVYQF